MWLWRGIFSEFWKSSRDFVCKTIFILKFLIKHDQTRSQWLCYTSSFQDKISSKINHLKLPKLGIYSRNEPEFITKKGFINTHEANRVKFNPKHSVENRSESSSLKHFQCINKMLSIGSAAGNLKLITRKPRSSRACRDWTPQRNREGFKLVRHTCKREMSANTCRKLFKSQFLSKSKPVCRWI